MQIRELAPLALLAMLAACSGNSLNNGTEEPDDGTDGVVTLPGTENPSPNAAVKRYEDRDETNGNGYATDIVYDAESDTFSVDNLGFDGDNAYTRGTRVGSLGPFAVYEGAEIYPDDVTGQPIGQFTHRALHAVSPSGKTELSIVRTGSYIGYGFGGFVYERKGGVTLPQSGQAAYSGDYAALRDFDGLGRLEYATGDMTMAIDFKDFDEGSAVQGQVDNRAIFDIAGNDITDRVLAELNEKNETSYTELPVLRFAVGPGVIDRNGEMSGGVRSSVSTGSGAVTVYESGTYYAVLSGKNATEVAGIIVVESDDPRFDGVKVRETGGFILQRP